MSLATKGSNPHVPVGTIGRADQKEIETMEGRERKSYVPEYVSIYDKLKNAFKDKCEEHGEDELCASFSMKAIGQIIDEFEMEQKIERETKWQSMPFGKYRNKKIEHIALLDEKYLKWVANQSFMENYIPLKRNIINVLKSLEDDE